MLLSAPPGQRPDYLADDVGGLLVAHPGVGLDAGVAVCGRWSARLGDGVIELESSSADTDGASRPEQLDALRALCELAWRAGVLALHAVGSAAEAAFDGLGLRCAG